MRFSRTESLLGKEAVAKLNKSSVAVFGIGGVGGHAAEALARSGVGKLILIDFDKVSESNINRQIFALTSTVGKLKCDVARDRLLDINPSLTVVTYPVFVDESNISSILSSERPDYIIDCIDSVKSKVCLAKTALEMQIPIISSMGTGNKIEPQKLMISDISKTHTCPLARVMRRELKAASITHLDVIFSSEIPRQSTVEENGRHAPASCSFVPSVAGLMLAGYVIKKLGGVI